MNRRTLSMHLHGPGPKRILALDGGGIRGILTLGYLKQMEDLLRQRVGGDPDFRLCDYFDLIGGTSTGSIIAAGLALGFSVDRLLELYRDLGQQVFTATGWTQFLPQKLQGVLAAKFPTAPVDAALQAQIGPHTTLGDAALWTGLMLMTKRLDTASPWPLHNIPEGAFFDQRPGENNIPNKDFRLWQIVRASTAAPTYFEPELVEVSSDEDGRTVRGAFVDGGVSPHGNPALQLFLLATLKGFHLEWPRGEDQLLLVSVGTGYDVPRLSAEETVRLLPADMAVRSLTSMMGDVEALARLMLQLLGKTLFSMPKEIDSEVGDLSADTLDGRKLLSYVRYNALFERAWLSEKLQLEFTEQEVATLVPMDNPANIERLAIIGARAAAYQVKPEHFPDAFDLT